VDFREYIDVLARYRRVALLTFLATIGVTIAGTLLTTPMYTATATLRVMPLNTQPVDYADYVYAERLMQTYSEIATTDSVLDEVKQTLSVAELPSISVANVPGTELLRVMASHADPQLAQQTANSLVNTVAARGLQPADQSISGHLWDMIDQMDSELADLREQRDRLTAQPSPAPDELAEVERLIRLKEDFRAILLQDYENSRVSETLGIASIAVVQYAALPQSPSSPNTMLNLVIGLVVGAMGGIFLAFASHALDMRIFSLADLQALVPWPLWAKIPRVRSRLRRNPYPRALLNDNAYREACSELSITLLRFRSENPDMLSLVNGDQKRAIVTQMNLATTKELTKLPGVGPHLADAIVRYRSEHGPFRSLESLTDVPNISWTRISAIVRHVVPRSEIGHSFVGNGSSHSPCVVAVVSAQLGEGKSTLVANLALMLANLGCCVVVVDADLRQPHQHTLFKLPNQHGLSTVMRGEATVENVLQPTSNDHLRILTSGPATSDPAQLLLSDYLSEALKQIKHSGLGADIITLIDTPPLVPVNDAIMVARLADMTLLLVCLGVTHRKDVVDVARKLERHTIKPVRVILNRETTSRSPYLYDKSARHAKYTG